MASAGRYLIWSICFGERGLRAGRAWLDAVVRVGGWEHDIVLLGGQWVRQLAGTRVRAVDIVDDVVARSGRPRERWTHWTLNNLKSQILHYADVAGYDYLLYLDLDVLINTGRLPGAVQAKRERGKVAVQREQNPLRGRRVRALERLGFPDARELFEWARRPIGAGIMGFPTTPAGLAVLHAYDRACADMGFDLSDQAKLTALLNRRHRDDWEYMGDTTFGRRAFPRYEETFVHFAGQRDALFHGYHRLNLTQSTWPARLRTRLWVALEDWNYRRARRVREETYWHPPTLVHL